MCLTLAAGEQEKSSPQEQMRETCLPSLPQRQGPSLACSSPVQGRGTGGSGWLFCCSEEPLCSSWSGGKCATLLERARWDFHKIQGSLAVRSSRAVFSHSVIFNFPSQTEAEKFLEAPRGREDDYHLCSVVCSPRRSAACCMLASPDCRARPC